MNKLDDLKILVLSQRAVEGWLDSFSFCVKEFTSRIILFSSFFVMHVIPERFLDKFSKLEKPFRNQKYNSFQWFRMVSVYSTEMASRLTSIVRKTSFVKLWAFLKCEH